MESIGDSSSSCLIDIQIEESLSRETLMSIDSANQKEDCGIFTLCSITLTICFFLSFLLPNLTTTIKYNYKLRDRDMSFSSPNHQSSIELSKNIKQKYVSFSIESLSSLNQFLSLSVSFIRKSIPNTLNEMDLSYNHMNYSNNDLLILFTDITIQTDLSNKAHETDFSSHSLSDSFLYFAKDQNISQKVPLLKNQLTKYTTFASTVSISCNKLNNEPNNKLFDDIIECRVYWTFGNSSIPFYQSFIKLLFFTINFISLISFLWRTRYTSVYVLHLEQILSIFLLFFTFLIDNPFHYIFIVKLPKFSMIYDEITKTIFNIYLRFFVLVLFDSLRFKNRRIGRCFFTPKLFFFLFFLLFELLSSLIQAKKVGHFQYPNSVLQKLHSTEINAANFKQFYQNEAKISKEVNLYSNERLLHSNLFFGLIDNSDHYAGNNNFYEKSIFFLSKLFELAFIFWIVFVIVRSFRDIDVTERYKFFVYFSVSSLMFLLTEVSDWILSRMERFGNTLLPFLFKLSVYNIFGLLMMFFHWPYELITDQQYLDPEEGDGDVADFYNESDKSNDTI